MITDGLSNTLMASEGYIGHPQYRACFRTPATPSAIIGPWSPINVPAPGPQSVAALNALIGPANCSNPGTGIKAGGPIGHTRWANGGVYYSGFTTAMPPNHRVSARVNAINVSDSGKTLPMDWASVDENDGGPTYMSLSASSYHPGGVTCLFADGSVRYVKNTVDPRTWRALGTIGGGEVISGDSY